MVSKKISRNSSGVAYELWSEMVADDITALSRQSTGI